MNPLAMLWAERQVAKAQAAELRRLAAEVRQKQDALRPMIAAANARQKVAMRQDGPKGFVMVPK